MEFFLTRVKERVDGVPAKLFIVKLLLADSDIIFNASLGFAIEALAIAVQVRDLIVGKLESKVVVKRGLSNVVGSVFREHIDKILLNGRGVCVVWVDDDALLVLAVEWGGGVQIKAVLNDRSGFN